MAELRVTYFDFAGGRGEEVRLALQIAGIAFDDKRINRETFAKIKGDLPFASLPILEVEGLGVFSQTNAILRLIGRQYNMYPSEPIDAALHDTLMEAVEDLRHRITTTTRIRDASEKKEARQQLAAGYLPQWGRTVESMIGAGPFVGGEQASVADIKLYMVDRWISGGGVDDVPPEIFDPYRNLKAVAEGIKTHPAVVAWYA